MYAKKRIIYGLSIVFLLLTTFNANAQAAKSKKKPVQKSTKMTTVTTPITTALNVLDKPLMSCCFDPKTGYFRDGYCRTRYDDAGTHVVCAVITQEFLTFTKSRGNDLETPFPQFDFPGLKPGDRWCLCALRWQEAFEAGFAPPVVLSSTNKIALKYTKLEDLQKHAAKE